MKITVIAGNGIGGTEKAAFIYAAELARRGHQVSALTNADGPRSSTLLEAGVRIEEIPFTSTTLQEHFADFKPDIVHQHVSGYSDQRALYEAIDRFPGKRPKIIETNVFGRLMDRHDRNHVSFRMFVSLASGCQAFQRPMVEMTRPELERHSVLSNPLSSYHPPTAEVRAGIRRELGILPGDFLIIRLGRPGGKWTSWDCEAFSIARKKDPSMKLLLMEPSAELTAEIRRGRWGNGIIIHKASSDFDFISNLYGSADGMIHASDYGESFGYTLAEAMQAGLPIITLSTPWGDNAQVQLVRNGITGYVCCSTRGMAGAALKIRGREEIRKRMSEQARAHISGICDLSRDTDLLEEIMASVTGSTPGPLMKKQFEEWMAYRNNTFDVAQNDLDDHHSKLSVAGWKLYDSYRRTKTALRHAIERRRQRGTSPEISGRHTETTAP